MVNAPFTFFVPAEKGTRFKRHAGTAMVGKTFMLEFANGIQQLEVSHCVVEENPHGLRVTAKPIFTAQDVTEDSE